MTTVYRSNQVSRIRAGAMAGLHRVCRAVVRRVRAWPRQAWRFISDREQYVADRNLRRELADEWGDKAAFFARAFRQLRINGISGDYLEFGTGRGNCFTRAYHAACRMGYPARFWAFDSFAGMPASDDPRDSHPGWGWQAGNFAVPLGTFLDRCRKAGMSRDRFEIVPGFFSDSLAPGSPAYHRLPEDVAFAYIGSAFYSSAKTVLDFLTPRLKHGMILAFDNYFCLSSNGVAGERLAFLELQKKAPQFKFLPYIQFGSVSMSFIAENLTHIGGL